VTRLNRPLPDFIFVPTRQDADGTRHIITQRNGPPLCGADMTGAAAQQVPMQWQRGAVCPRCEQRYMRRLNIAATWED
jgi:hypothetical protein